MSSALMAATIHAFMAPTWTVPRNARTVGPPHCCATADAMQLASQHASMLRTIAARISKPPKAILPQTQFPEQNFSVVKLTGEQQKYPNLTLASPLGSVKQSGRSAT